MKKWNLIVDVANCTNCNLCALALQDEHVGNAFPGYAEEMPKHGHRWIEITSRERGTPPVTDVAYLPTMCQHCDDAPCIAAAPDAIAKRDDGIVLIDPEKAKGRRDIVDACPYGAIWWNEEKQVPQHWFFDAHLLDSGWTEPRCVTVCATDALQAVKVEDDEMQRLILEQELEQLRPDLETKPRVHYKNLWRYTKVFIAGTVSAEKQGIVDCLAGATVTLLREGQKVAEQRTDAFGDFKFDRLDADSSDYELNIAADGFAVATVELSLSETKNVGDVRLSPL
ncbi:MAG: carboxypeptidase regulatory-like domain-containing protein [Alphaproteobacteria bacterium]|nr:carboxypeptidase regulatory-like domain-containing protein [Alphaproteobacteria bacterium]